MKTRRERDILIAEKIMNWHNTPDGIWLPPGTNIDPSQAHRWPKRYYGPDADTHVPNYSTDIVAAMEMLEKLRKSGKYCCIKIDSDYHYVWEVSFTLANKDDPEHKPDVRVSGDSLPEVICLAALKAERIE